MNGSEEDRFVNLIDGKKLKRFLIELSVQTDGTITGLGAGTNVTGNWNYKINIFVATCPGVIATLGLIAKKLS